LEPYIDPLRDSEELIRKTIGFGIIVWNIATAKKFPDEPFSRLIENVAQKMEINIGENESIKELMHRKEMFDELAFFVVEHYIMFPGGLPHLTVSVLEIS
jgi:hypothetical protein